MSATQYYGTGRRKTSTARVFMRSGAGSAHAQLELARVAEELRDELDKLARGQLTSEQQLEKAEAIIAVQKNSPTYLGWPPTRLPPTPRDDPDS